MSHPHRAIGIVLAVLLLTPGLHAADRKGNPDEELLRKAGIGTDSAKLLAFVRQRSEAGEDLRNLDALVRRLGHDEFVEREKSTAKLIALGREALPALKRVTADRDAEVAQNGGIRYPEPVTNRCKRRSRTRTHEHPGRREPSPRCPFEGAPGLLPRQGSFSITRVSGALCLEPQRGDRQ
jgi:hypothetical protein